MAFFGNSWKDDVKDDGPMVPSSWKEEDDNPHDIPQPLTTEAEQDKKKVEFYESLANIHIHNDRIEFNYGTLLCSMCRDGINLLIQKEDIPKLKDWWEKNKKS